jgi:formate dehydrogenase major subunit
MFRLPLFMQSSGRSPQPLSPQSSAKASRLRGATVVEGVCPYCAVGCGQLIYTKKGTIVDIEGDPRSPISEGTLCPKGANSYQLSVNPHRVREVMYRAPYSDRWEKKPLEWAMDRLAERIKAAREADFQVRNEKGERIGGFTSVGVLGGATLDVEENYLMKKLFSGGLGIIPIENQARI